MNKSHEVGVIIGRFQPLHMGHLWIIKKALEKFEKIIILVGSSNVTNEHNPWSINKRMEMINLFLEHENLKERVTKIEEIEDVPDDNKWLKISLSKIDTDNFVVVGDNEWVNGIFEKSGYKVLRTGYFDRHIFEGAKIRSLIYKNKKWEDRVPNYLVELIKS